MNAHHTPGTRYAYRMQDGTFFAGFRGPGFLSYAMSPQSAYWQASPTLHRSIKQRIADHGMRIVDTSRF